MQETTGQKIEKLSVQEQIAAANFYFNKTVQAIENISHLPSTNSDILKKTSINYIENIIINKKFDLDQIIQEIAKLISLNRDSYKVINSGFSFNPTYNAVAKSVNTELNTLQSNFSNLKIDQHNLSKEQLKTELQRLQDLPSSSNLTVRKMPNTENELQTNDMFTL